MKSEFSNSYKTQKLQRPVRERYPTSQAVPEAWSNTDKATLARPLPLEKIRPDPENVSGSSPKLKLKIHEFSTRLSQHDSKRVQKAIPTARDGLETKQEPYCPFPLKNSTRSTQMQIQSTGKINKAEYINTKEGELGSSGGKAHSPKLKKLIKLRSADENHSQDFRRFSQPNQVNSICQINLINPASPFTQINSGSKIEQKELDRSESKKTGSSEKKPSLIAINAKKAKDIQVDSLKKFHEHGLSQRNLNIPKLENPGLKEQVQSEKKEIKKNIYISSPLKQVGEESPSRYEDSPPIKVNLVRAMGKTKPKTDSKGQLAKVSGEKASEQVNKKINTRLLEEMEQADSSKKKSFSKILDISIAKPDWAPIAMKKLVDSRKESLDAKSSRSSLECKLRASRVSHGFTTVKIFKEVLEFLCLTSMCQMTRVSKKFRSGEHLRLLRKAQCRLIIQGLSDEDQYGFWDFHVNFNSIQKTYPLQYLMNEMKQSRFERDILSDIDRTHVFNDFLGSRQNSLLKVLVAFSNAVPKIGYIQGLNSIAAVFLSHKISESEAYWLMKYIFKRKRVDVVLSDGFSRVQLLTYQLEIYMRNYVPDVIDYLGENGINISYFATQWFITMFAYDLELSQLTKFWNLFFIKGWKVLIRMALTLLYHFQDEICSQDSDELPCFLKNFVRERISEIPEDELFGVALSFKVSNRLLKYLETLYEHSAPINVILVSNAESKLEWRILPEDCSSVLDVSIATQKDVMDYLNENIDQLRTRNKMKGDVHNEIDNYRSIHQDTVNTSITLDNISFECRSSITSLPGRDQNSKSLDQSFIQTLSNFGRRLKQILTPKDNGQETLIHQKKLTNAKILDFTNDKDALESYATLTDRSACRASTGMNRANSNLIVSSDAHDSAPFKKSIVSMMRDSNDKLGINLFDPLNFSTHRDRDSYRQLNPGSKTTTASTNDALEMERELMMAELKTKQRKGNSSFTQELMGSSMRKSQIVCLLDEKSEDEGTPVARYTEYMPSSSLRKSQSDINRSMQLSRRISLHDNGSFLSSEGLGKEETMERTRIGVSTRDMGDRHRLYDLRESRHYERSIGMIIPEETW